jgi:hypothetical protein
VSASLKTPQAELGSPFVERTADRCVGLLARTFSRATEDAAQRLRDHTETMRYLASAALGIVGIVALTATSASAAIVCNGECDCWHAKKKCDYRQVSTFRFTPTIGDGRKPITGNIVGASMKDPAIGAVASGSASSLLLGRGSSLFADLTAGTFLGLVRSLSPLASARPSPPEPIARSGKRLRESPAHPPGFFFVSVSTQLRLDSTGQPSVFCRTSIRSCLDSALI